MSFNVQERMLNHSVQRTSNSATNETADEIAKGASIAFDSRYHPSLLAIPPRHANFVPFEGGAAVAEHSEDPSSTAILDHLLQFWLVLLN